MMLSEVLNELEDYGIFEGQVYPGELINLPSSEKCYISNDRLVFFHNDVPPVKQSRFLTRIGAEEAVLDFRTRDFSIYFIDKTWNLETEIVDFFKVEGYEKESISGNRIVINGQ